MVKKTIIALVIATMGISNISARFCHDEYGNRVSCTGKVVSGAGEVAGDTVEGAGGLAANILTFGHYNKEKEEERRQRQEEKRREREERRQERD